MTDDLGENAGSSDCERRSLAVVETAFDVNRLTKHSFRIRASIGFQISCWRPTSRLGVWIGIVFFRAFDARTSVATCCKLLNNRDTEACAVFNVANSLCLSVSRMKALQYFAAVISAQRSALVAMLLCRGHVLEKGLE